MRGAVCCASVPVAPLEATGGYRRASGRARRASGREPKGSRSNEDAKGSRTDAAPPRAPPRSNAKASRSRESDLAGRWVGKPWGSRVVAGWAGAYRAPPSRGGSRPVPLASASYRRACHSRSRSEGSGGGRVRVRRSVRVPPRLPHHVYAIHALKTRENLLGTRAR